MTGGGGIHDAENTCSISPEYRQRVIELVRAGSEAEAFQTDRGAGRREDGLGSAERQELTRLRQASQRLTRDRLDLAQGFESVKANQTKHQIAILCRTWGVFPNGYCARLTRSTSKRALEDVVLSGRIRSIHTARAARTGSSGSMPS